MILGNWFLKYPWEWREDNQARAGGVRHHPQRFMDKTVYVPYFNRDTVEFAFRERDVSKPGIKILLPFLKNITEESDLENFQDLILALDACYWLHKVISISLSRFGDYRRCDFSRFYEAISCFSEDFRYCLALCLYVYFYLRRVKEICSSYLDFCSNKIFVHLKVTFDRLYYRARRESANKEQGEKSCIVSHNSFIFIDNFILFCKQRLFVILISK